LLLHSKFPVRLIRSILASFPTLQLFFPHPPVPFPLETFFGVSKPLPYPSPPHNPLMFFFSLPWTLFITRFNMRVSVYAPLHEVDATTQVNLLLSFLVEFRVDGSPPTQFQERVRTTPKRLISQPGHRPRPSRPLPQFSLEFQVPLSRLIRCFPPLRV